MRAMILRTTSTFMLSGILALSACGTGTEGTEQTSPTVESTTLRPVVTPCEGKCDGPGQVWTSPYKADIDKLNALWPDTYPMKSVEDAFMVRMELGDVAFDAPTHLYGGPLNVIPYNNKDNVEDASGVLWERGDAAIAQAFGPGTIGFMIKHHRPSHRVLNPESLSADLKEQAKLQITHLGIVVGVERDGGVGAITLNNPQSYESGKFGTPDYPMIFVKPTWPEYLDPNQAQAFNDNTLLMMAGFNAVSNFPGDYNGGDPLGAHTVERLKQYTEQMVRAIAGDEEALEFFKDPATELYCAELGFVGMSAGLHFPLNAETMVPLVGQEVWDAFLAEVSLHNEGKESAFTSLNSNDQVQHIRFHLPPEDLKAMHSYSPEASELADKLAFKPMTMADIVQHFLRTHVPREFLGEQIAPVQGKLLEAMKPGLLEAMAMDALPEEDPRRMALDQFFAALVGVVSTSYGSYDEFQQNLAPLMAQARQMTGPRDMSGTGYFVPPSLYHVVTQGKHKGGLIGLSYVGHGLHTSVTYDPDASPVDLDMGSSDDSQDMSNDMSMEPVLPPDNPYAGSCANACGGASPDGTCYCDDACAEYGDCCADIQVECLEP